MLYILVVKYRLFGFQYSQNPYCGFPKTDYNIKVGLNYIYNGHHPRRSKFQIQTVPIPKTENMKMDKNFIENFRLPRYNEIPNVGLYLEQVIKYIN